MEGILSSDKTVEMLRWKRQQQQQQQQQDEDDEDDSLAALFDTSDSIDVSTTVASSGGGEGWRLMAGRQWHIVPVLSLATFLREWSAVHSISSHTLMPLAPYLMKGAPVTSYQALRPVARDFLFSFSFSFLFLSYYTFIFVTKERIFTFNALF